MAIMSPDEAREFLRDGVRTGKLATTRADGRPHVAPVWYLLDGEDIVFNTGAATVKGRNLIREGRAAICVDDDQPPYSFVIVQGPVEIVEDLGEVRRFATALGGRYMGADRAEEYGARNGVPGELLVRLRIERIAGERDLAD